MRPEAATSQADSPPCWTNASNRPVAPYASARAAEPIEREMRIALRTLRARLAAARPVVGRIYTLSADGIRDQTTADRVGLPNWRSARRSPVAGYRAPRAV